MDLMGLLAHNIAGKNYGHLPREAVDSAKKALLDTLGVMLAGGGELEAKTISGLVKEWGGKEESSVFNCGFRAPAPQAALANATMARVLDLDDVFEKAALHVHGSVVPAAIALAEKIVPLPGSRLLEAIILGADLLCRLGLANKIPTAVSGMNSTFQYGTFGTTGACGKLMRLDEEKLLNAMGIAYSLVAGNSQCILEGVMTTSLGQGMCAHGGLFSALLAKRGFTGARNVLQGEFGYFNCYQRGEYDPNTPLEGLGEIYLGSEVTCKRYPCCTQTHAAMDGAIELVNKHNLNPQNLESIRVGVNQQAYNLTGHSLETKKGSWGISAAKFSLPYCISVAIWKRKVFIEDFTKKAINDLNVIGTAKKVEVYVDPEIEAKVSTGVSLANVEFYTRDGSHYRAQSGALNGGSKVSLSFEGVAKKFVACNNAASRPLSTRKLSEIIDIVMDLEKLADIQELTRKFG